MQAKLYIPNEEVGDSVNKMVNIESGTSKSYQLYNLKTDIGEKKNLIFTEPQKLKRDDVALETQGKRRLKSRKAGVALINRINLPGYQ